MRAFVALDLPEGMLGALTALQAGLELGRVVPEDNLHLTLAFLGEVPEAALPDLAEALSGVAMPPVRLGLRGLDLFGGRHPGVLYAAAVGEGLDRLHDKVARAAREAGLSLPRERFRPHVTLARLPRDLGPKDARRLGEFLALNGAFALPPEPVGRFTLYRSHLRPEGALHEPLADFEFAG